MPRPPVQAARKEAAKRLIARYQTEFDSLVTEYLSDSGWHQEEVTRQKWVQQPAKSDG